ncbi:MAG: sigma-54-dependent Fis family transcriptional regulator [Phycisphaeraceae bacterium]|nr:sigma-54-dependent Fis family transcriptional regulator [Phycisphaeraceae bacterium]
MNTVLVVDDKEMMRDSVGATLQRAGFGVMTADSAEKALDLVARRRPDAVISDLKMPGMTGLELLEKLRGIDEDLPVVLMTAFGTIETAVRAIKLGAFDYITKPFEGDELIIAVKRAIAHARVVRENAVLRAAGQPQSAAHGGTGGLDRLLGDSPAMRRVKEQVRAVADSHGNVLVMGESGTGKEVVSRAIHELSSRRDRPFLGVNCAALTESLLESELFGHERGAFTGAERLRKGRFELADGGTLLLDEISEISPHVQAKLLRVLQERTFERVGSSLSIGVDVRVIATSNRDLPRTVSSGGFRQDLFFRLNVLPIHLPPLRDRLEDVPTLAAAFVDRISRREGRPPLRFSAGAEALMQGYDWPGNVRELQNICERAVVLSQARGNLAEIPRDMIEPWLLAVRAGYSISPPSTLVEPKPVDAHTHNGNGAHHQPPRNSPRTSPIVHNPDEGPIRPLEEIERQVIVDTLRRFNGHRQRTAHALGIGVRTLGLKLKKWKEQELVEHGL